MSLVRFLGITAVVALLATFIYILLMKWGVWEYLQVHADAWISKLIHKEVSFFNKLFSCPFCITWWVSVLICIFFFILSGYVEILLVPFCSTPLARHLLG